jgi:hypothetical protein
MQEPKTENPRQAGPNYGVLMLELRATLSCAQGAQEYAQG